jgi:exoribonuclease-2
VGAGSPIDAHALLNTTSVYTAAQIFPMLPERLSTNLTSLAEDQERLAIVFEMTIAPDGQVLESSLYRALVRNQAKLAYAAVAAWLEGRAGAPARVQESRELQQQLRLQDEVAQQLRGLRHQHGALDLQTEEARAVFDNGLLSDLKPEPQNRAHELIEDLMIAANGVSASYLQRKGLPSIRRVLRTPERWDRLVLMARELGDALPAVPDAAALNAFLQRRKRVDPEHFADLSLRVVKSLGSGEYALQRPGAGSAGHFALATRDYAHSTAPNRRFPDLLTQRLLKASLQGRPSPYSETELQGLAAHCTVQENNAAKVERQVRKSAAAMLLASRVGQRFQGIVTGVSDKGTWVRVTSPAAEGRIIRGYEALDVGDPVSVELIHTDIARGFVDFARCR